MTPFWWAILTACIWGMVPLLEKSGLTKVEPIVALFYRSIGVVVGMIIMGIFLVKPNQIRSVDSRSIFVLILAGFLASFVAQITFYHGLKMGEVSKVVPVAGAYYLVTFILGVLLFGETITAAKVFGISLIVSGMLFLR